jgi:pilus assembly protein Flp/PilA
MSPKGNAWERGGAWAQWILREVQDISFRIKGLREAWLFWRLARGMLEGWCGSGFGRTQFHQIERKHMMNFLKKLWKEEEGQDLTEYGLLLVLVALAAIGSMGVLADAINNAFSNAASHLNSTTS